MSDQSTVIDERDIQAGVFTRTEKSLTERKPWTTGGEGGPVDLADRDGRYFMYSKWAAATAAVMDPATFACVSKLTEDIAAADWRIVDRNSGETLGDRESIFSDEPMTRLLHDVSDREDGISPFYIWSLMLLTTGEAYWQYVFNRTGRLESLDWLNSLCTDPQYPRGVIDSFTYSGPDKYMVLPADQVVYDRLRNNLMTDFHGFAPVMTAIAANRIQIGQSAGRAALSYFANDGMPYAIVSPKESQGEWEHEEVAYVTETMRAGKSSRGKFRTLVIPYPYDAQLFQQPDVQKWADLIASFSPDIYRVYRVPPPIVGDTTTPYQNDEENRKNYDTGIVGRLRAIAGVINTNPMRRIYGVRPSAYFEFELSPWQHIDDQERQASKDLYDRGLADGNELRTAYGWKEVPWLKGKRLDPASQQLVDIPDPNAPAAAPATPAPQAAPVGAPDDTSKDFGAGSFCVALDLGGNPDLIDLQSRAKALSGDAPFEPNAPDKFHLTLAYVPDTDETTRAAMLEAVRAIPVPELSMVIGSLGSFDRVGESAVHFRTRRNTALNDYQHEVAEAIRAAGGQLSAFSDPARFIPHITMGYMKGGKLRQTFNSNLSVKPRGLVVWGGDKTLYRSAESAPIDEVRAFAKFYRPGKLEKRTFIWQHNDADTAALIERDFEEGEYRETRKKWIGAIAARSGDTSGITAPLDLYVGVTAEAIKSWREYGFEDDEIVEAAKTFYLGTLAIKAQSRTQNRFETAAFQLFRRAQLERMTKGAFEAAFTKLVDDSLEPELIAGYADGGIEEHELTDRDKAWLSSHQSEARGHIRKVAEALFSDDKLTDDEIKGKPRAWYNLTIHPAYNEGLARAAKDGLGVFVRGNTSDGCRDCKGLDGKIYPMSVWFNHFGRQLPPCDKTECGGFECKCRVKPTRGKATKGQLPRLHGRRKSADLESELEHDHVHA